MIAYSAESTSVTNDANIVIETVSVRTVILNRFFCLLAFREARLPETPNSRPESERRFIFLTSLSRVVIVSIGALRTARIPTPYADRKTQMIPTVADMRSILISTEKGRLSFAFVIPWKSCASPAARSE